jgi:low molecular weight protein-tyrosine phosphatase
MSTQRPFRITVVCTGNICRSPMAELVLRERFEEAGLDGRVVVDSAGTHSYEVGKPADPRTLAVLARQGHARSVGSEHVARQFEQAWFDDVDLILAADAGHFRELTSLAHNDEQRAKIRMLRSFDPESARTGDLDMDDPWFGDDSSFDRTYAEVIAAADGVVEHVRRELDRA